MANGLATYSKMIESELIDPLRLVLKGRQLVHVTAPAGFGVTSVDWSKITDISDGMVSYGFSSGNVDAIDTTLTNSKVPVYWKDYTVDRRSYEGWMTKGIDFDAASAIAAGYKAAKAENAAIVQGVTQDGTNYDINGLYTGAGNDFSTSADFATFGNATIALAGAYALMDADGIPVDTLPMNMVLSPTQFQQLNSSRSTTGMRERPDILDMLNGGGIYSDNALTAGTGFVAPTKEVGKPYIDFFLTQDFTVENGFDSEHPDTGDLSGRVYSAGILRIKQSNAISKLSAI